MGNLLALHERLLNMTYQHSPYKAFVISDPKTRSIHKACVADRVLHRALYRKLSPSFDRIFIADSFSCRMNKGTHKALKRFKRFSDQVSKNHHKTVWVLKCDIRKFFASIDQQILLQILDARIADKRIVWLLQRVTSSFSSAEEGIGLPLGNLTSQLFSNVYLNVFDQFVKHQLHEKYYIRYADDFVFFSRDCRYLEQIFPMLADFLWRELHLQLHPNKIELRTIASGVDFLGWVHFSDHRVLRTTTKRRMMNAIQRNPKTSVVASYQGLLKHGNAFGLSQLVKNNTLG